VCAPATTLRHRDVATKGRPRTAGLGWLALATDVRAPQTDLPPAIFGDALKK
jgi:hypothetical protein